jgi:exopolysaccharide production protein ExoQ
MLPRVPILGCFPHAMQLQTERTFSDADALRRGLETSFAVIAIAVYTGALLPARLELMGIDSAAEPNDPVARYTFVAIYLFSLLTLITRWRQVRAVLSAHLPLMLLVGLAFASTVWSVDSQQTLRRAVGLAGSTGFAMMLCTVFRPRELWNVFAAAFFLSAILSIVMVVVLPDFAIMSGVHEGAWRGAYPHKNSLGGMMALGVVLGALCRPSTRMRKLAAIWCTVLCFMLMLLSLSRTGLVLTLVMPLILFVAWFIRLRLRVLLPSAVLLTLSAGAGLYLLIMSIGVLMELLGRDLTLTGRTLIWAVLAEAVLSRPILGFGFGAFWSSSGAAGVATLGTLDWNPSSAHNAWLELALALGLTGVCLMLLSVSVTAFKLLRGIRRSREIEAVVPLVALAAILLLSIVESGFVRANGVNWLLYSAIALTAGKSFARHDRMKGPALPPALASSQPYPS